MLKQIEIDSPQKHIKYFNSDKKTIYYVYDASGYKQEYFPQKVFLYFKDEIALLSWNFLFIKVF